MGELYNVDKGTILNYAKEIGYKNHYRFELTEEQKKYIIDNYHNKLSKELADELGCSVSLIKSVWRKSDICNNKVRRTYHVNDDYFSSIDTKDKAYILGYLAADGCVYKRDGRIGMISFACKNNDIELLHMINQYMNSNYKIMIKERYCSLQINSDILVNDLSKYNITPRKTWTYYPVSLKNEYLNWHFIRGYFDGDGSIYKTPNISGNITPSSYRYTICGNFKTMQWMNNFLNENGVKSKMYQDKRKLHYSQDFYYINIRVIKSIYNMFNKMYHDSENLRLERKYNRSKEFINLYQSYYLN